jgi:ubiquinone biosynthesis protein UbiJ
MQLAQTAPSSEAREHFAELSQTWLRLAGDIETGQTLVDLLNDFDEPERRAG